MIIALAQYMCLNVLQIWGKRDYRDATKPMGLIEFQRKLATEKTHHQKEHPKTSALEFCSNAANGI